MSKYVDNVKKYVESPNTDAIDSLVGHLGIALDNHDTALVAVTDPKELETIRDGYCNTNLDLDKEQAEAAIAKVSEIMKGDHAKCRVTFYYLLAQESDTMHRLC